TPPASKTGAGQSERSTASVRGSGRGVRFLRSFFFTAGAAGPCSSLSKNPSAIGNLRCCQLKDCERVVEMPLQRLDQLLQVLLAHDRRPDLDLGAVVND